jgi:hypothetical protein
LASKLRHDLSMMVVPLISRSNDKIGLLRLFKSGHITLNKQLQKKVESVSVQVQAFVERVLGTRAFLFKINK